MDDQLLLLELDPRGCWWDGMRLVGECGRTGYPSYEWVQLSRRPRSRGASEESHVVVEHLDHLVAPLYSYIASIPLVQNRRKSTLKDRSLTHTTNGMCAGCQCIIPVSSTDDRV